MEAVLKKWCVFTHDDSGAMIVLRYYQDEETVSPTDLAIVRRVREDFGVLSAEEFRSALEQAAVTR